MTIRKFAASMGGAMNERYEKVIDLTESFCPVCLDRISARRIAVDEEVYLARPVRRTES